jgi:pyruvate formate lyase activating enzyme
MSQWIVKELGPDVPLHFTAFHPDYKMTGIAPTPAATLTRARRIALEAGVRYVYTGNVHDRTGGTTFCPGCARPVIERDWHEILRYDLTDDGRCSHCEAQLPGRFAAFGGQWGRRRVPVRVSVQGTGSARPRARVRPQSP